MAAEAFTKALDGGPEVELTFTGRKSGREFSIPVWFVHEGDALSLVPIHGTDSGWFRNVVQTPTIRLRVGDAQVSARATPVTDPDKVGQILDTFRAKYGAGEVASYYSKQNAAVAVQLA
jgi:deazaflavin-dependent oxidoreductase (nitroreductase family)